MNKRLITIILMTCFFFIIFQKELLADENYFDTSKKLFVQMFGKEFAQVKATKTKKDDVKYGLKLLENASSLESKPSLQTYIKYQSAHLLQNSIKFKKRARDLYSETIDDLPASVKIIVKKEMLVLQKSILSKTSKKNKNNYLVEVEIYVSYAQLVANESIKKNEYSEAIKQLKNAFRYLKMVDRSAAKQLNKQIKSVMQASRRFNQVKAFIKLLDNKPNDAKANLALANYYFIEKGDLYKAWPYFEKSGDESFISFYKNIKHCIDDNKLKTLDGVSISTYPLINDHPAIYLNWLASKDLDDPMNVISDQLKLINTSKEVKTNKIKLVVLNTIKIKGVMRDVSYKTYMKLAEDFAKLAAKTIKQKNINKPSEKFLIDQLLLNQLIALSKAKIKLAKNTSIEEIVKLKLDMDVGQCLKTIKQRGLDIIDVKLETSFLFNKINVVNALSISGENTYTFDPGSWKKFKSDFEILASEIIYDPKDKSDLLIINGKLHLYSKSTYIFKSKKKKWNSNIEVSLELIKMPKQIVVIQFLLKPDDIRYKNTFSVFHYVYNNGGWYGILKEGESIEDFVKNDLTKYIKGDSGRSELWSEGKLKISTVFRKKTCEIFLNGKLYFSNPIERISKEKGFPNTSIQICVTRRAGAKLTNDPIKIDNIYIGPPKTKKKK